MPSYIVHWTHLAQSQLAHIWTIAQDRASVSAAANLIDNELARPPMPKGRLIAPDAYEYFAPPLAVAYQYHSRAGLVVVVAVRVLDPSRNGTTVVP